jgi:predicted transcriptional regulator of viral defense system
VKQTEALRLVGAYVADQGGLVTSAQAKIVGVDGVTLRRLVDAGLLERITHGVYGMPAAMAAEHLLERAAWLRLAAGRPGWERKSLDPDGGVLSHRSAAVLHGLGDLAPDIVEIMVPRRRTSRDPNVRLRIARLTDDEVTSVDGLPVTTVERTIVDLLADHADGGHVGDVIADAHRRNLVDLPALSKRVMRFATAYGIRDGGSGRGMKLIRQLLDQVGYRDVRDSDYGTAEDHGRQVLAVADRLVTLSPDELRSLAMLLQSPGLVEKVTRGISEQTQQVVADSSSTRALPREMAEMLRPTIEAASPETGRGHDDDRDHDDDDLDDETEAP